MKNSNVLILISLSIHDFFFVYISLYEELEFFLSEESHALIHLNSSLFTLRSSLYRHEGIHEFLQLQHAVTATHAAYLIILLYAIRLNARVIDDERYRLL